MSPPDGAERVRHIIDEAEEVTIEPPRPLMRELPPADPYPTDALGDVLGAAAQAINDRVQAPIAICGHSVFAAAALAAQGHADVVLPIGPGQARPLSCYLVSIALSGERKTAADNEAMRAVRQREAALREQFDADSLRYNNDRAAYDCTRGAALKSAGKPKRDTIVTALDDIGPAPQPPLTPILTCPEPTYEGMSRLLAEGQPSIGIFASEGGQFIGGHGMTNEARLRTATGFSAVWDSEPIRRVRGGDGVIILSGRRVSMHLMAQPSAADLWLRDQLLFDQGLLSRLLVTAPDSAMGRRLSHDEAPETEPAMARYSARLMSMLEHPLPTAECRPFELAPPPLTLSAVARRMWIGFADQIERMLGEGGELRAISGIANKLAEHAARIAGVLTLVRDIDAGEIAATEMAAGIELAQHYAAEALRLHGGSQVSAELRHAEQALDWMQRSYPNPVISLVDLYQRGPTAIRDAKRARQAVETLQDHGWLMPVEGGAKIDGVPRREAWRIVRVGP